MTSLSLRVILCFLAAYILVLCAEHLKKMRPKSKIYTPKRDDEHPRQFYMGLPPGS